MNAVLSVLVLVDGAVAVGVRASTTIEVLCRSRSRVSPSLPLQPTATKPDKTQDPELHVGHRSSLRRPPCQIDKAATAFTTRTISAFHVARSSFERRRVAQLAQRLRLDLPDALAGDLEVLTDLFERVVATSRRCRSACAAPSPRAASASPAPSASARRGSWR